MKPGIVLSSLTTTSPSGRTKKSTRAIPSQSVATNDCDGELLHALERLGRQPRGHDQIHPAVGVLRVEVVPVGVRDDLADDRRDRIAVAEHADLDLDSRLELLDEHLVVVAPGERHRLLELLVGLRAFEIPTDEPSRAGFTNTG